MGGLKNGVYKTMTKKYDELREVYVSLINEHERLKDTLRENEYDSHSDKMYDSGRRVATIEAIQDIEELLNKWAEEDSE